MNDTFLNMQHDQEHALNSLLNRDPSQVPCAVQYQTEPDGGEPAICAVRSDTGEVIARGETHSALLQHAQAAIIKSLPSHLLTREEFAGNALFISMGAVHRAPDNHHAGCDALDDLRVELEALYRRQFASLADSKELMEAFVGNSIAGLVHTRCSANAFGLRLPGGKSVFFVHDADLAYFGREAIASVVHAGEIRDALLEGKFVPAIVLQQYPNLIDQFSGCETPANDVEAEDAQACSPV